MNPCDPHAQGPGPLMLAALPRNPLHVVLDNIRSAFNVGSIMRTADACAVEHLHLCGMTAAPPHPRLERTALGAETTVPWTYSPTAGAALDRLEAQGIALVAIEIVPGAVEFCAFDWPRPVAVILGHETRGIAPELLARCQATVRIPMYGQKNSINVATAAGIIFYDILRRWGALTAAPRGAQQGFLEP